MTIVRVTTTTVVQERIEAPVQVQTRTPAGSIALTVLEAETLRAILWRVGGHPATSRRGHADTVLTKISKFLGSDEKRLPDPNLNDFEGHMYFNDQVVA